MTTLDDAIDQMQEFGLHVDVPMADGKLHRCNYQTERKKSGWYVLHQNNDLFTGRFGCWKLGEEGFKIMPRNSTRLDTEKAREIRELAIKRVEEKREEQSKAAEKAQKIWDGLSETGKSPYLTKKKIGAYGVRFSGSYVVIPMVREGRLRSLQSISPDGFKKFMKGGEVGGSHHIIKGSGRIALCEGYATGATIHEAMGWNVVVCFSASNLVKVSPYLANKDAVVCADYDETGIKYAKKTGLEIFLPEQEGTDFNDMDIENVRYRLS